MNTSELVVLVMALFVATAAWLTFYALRNKGDVRAELSHGSTTFKLEAKGRSGRRGRARDGKKSSQSKDLTNSN
jgi:hypothetical protein